MSLRRIVPVGFLAAALVVVGAPAASATTGAEGKPSVTVIAKRLDNPRGIAVGWHGQLYVAEAGKGGAGPCVSSPEDPEAQVCLGLSGAVTALSPHHRGKWKQKRVVKGLPSVAETDGSFALGLHDIAPVHPGFLLGTIGLGGTPEVRASLGPNARLLGHLVGMRLKRHGSDVKPIADLAAYEAANNPVGEIDSNPYGLLATPFGAYATDAGGNDLLRVDKRGNISTVAIFPDRPVTVPNLPPDFPMQAVPTTVTRGPDGALYVGQLTGFPFPVGAANVYRIVPGQQPEVFLSGFTNIIDIAFDRWGRLLVLQITKNGITSGDPTGALIRVDLKSGQRTELAAGKLTFPGGVAIGHDGSIYVTNKSVLPGAGEVLRIRA
ncbi:ScyD/ScyE family protein [Phytohabitans rumicis]|uniref:ScyD/ScyE family protein n=1 Tax=Phytohabitans rumicis TaxID=1076125 RepID=A0A6V8L489_9ACTN|nr:ScyD/ScyE family protein [Phytohabitans rumicis]GFJ90360.1 hypothetical protein Prum_040020 [Phytohabitans rumicis]